MNKFRLFFLLASSMLFACTTPEQRLQRQQAIEQKKVQYCANLGAPIGSDKYYDCRKWIEQELANETAQQNQSAEATMQQEQQQRIIQGQRIEQQQQNLINSLAHQAPSQTRCTTSAYGNQLQTLCNQ